jgi:hypothetical protein
MSGTGTYLCFGVFGLIILGNFACQIFVANKVFEGAQVVRGILRGTRTFIRGWKQADELGIRNVMIFWSALLSVLLLVIGAFLILALMYGSSVST